MSAADIGALMNGATVSLGGSPEFALVLLERGFRLPARLAATANRAREDRSSSWTAVAPCRAINPTSRAPGCYGEPTPRQRKVWNTVKRGQEIALETAKIGVAAGALDDAVRVYYESEGWGPGYKLPGLSHRTGHGIGLDGHEPAYLVHGDATPLESGMCFSDEPGIYIPGEFGVRLEDCWYMTANGAKLFTPLAKSSTIPI